jgi:hypothetical protein
MKRISLIIALSFFFVWLAILYAGADHPPPPGFVWIVLFDAIAAALVYWRTPTYIDWSMKRVKGRWLRVALDGIIAGLLFAALATMLNPNGGEPSTPPPGWSDRAIWFAVLAVVGLFNAVAVYVCAVIAARFAKQ